MKSDQYKITEGVEYFYIAGIDHNEIRVPKSPESLALLIELLAQNLGHVVIATEHVEPAKSTVQAAAQMLIDANINGAGIVVSQLKVLEKLLSRSIEKCQRN